MAKMMMIAILLQLVLLCWASDPKDKDAVVPVNIERLTYGVAYVPHRPKPSQGSRLQDGRKDDRTNDSKAREEIIQLFNTDRSHVTDYVPLKKDM